VDPLPVSGECSRCRHPNIHPALASVSGHLDLFCIRNCFGCNCQRDTVTVSLQEHKKIRVKILLYLESLNRVNLKMRKTTNKCESPSNEIMYVGPECINLGALRKVC
jgi:hypothetical protein